MLYIFLAFLFWLFVILSPSSLFMDFHTLIMSKLGLTLSITLIDHSFIYTIAFVKMFFIVFGFFIILPLLIEFIFLSHERLKLFYLAWQEYIWMYAHLTSYALGAIVLIVGHFWWELFGFTTHTIWIVSLLVTITLLLLFWFYHLVLKKR
ncbi:MAG: Unknown protein [uncultured Sulfurovum sp.]|uniref:Uncharacterized protein n=1 Tax=uncultured Sulfurovum sp. TaxID=269237 RepID=A0A6S6SMZ5_9BACT|nr:MAG: Unknown protein [uncultured Sulfurovum sp.]